MKAKIYYDQQLRRITTAPVLGAKKFIAKDHLETANIGYTGDDFNKLFLNKAEENVEGITVAIDRLEKDSSDAPIFAELGRRAEISLAHLLKRVHCSSMDAQT